MNQTFKQSADPSSNDHSSNKPDNRSINSSRNHANNQGVKNDQAIKRWTSTPNNQPSLKLAGQAINKSNHQSTNQMSNQSTIASSTKQTFDRSVNR